MRAMRNLLALALAAALQPAVADVVSLTFEDNATSTLIGDRYKSDLGISFTGGAWGLTSRYNGCTGRAQFLRDGSCGALELAFNATDTAGSDLQSFTMNLAGGFINQFSFVYSARIDSEALIQIFEGANGTGRVLQTLSSLQTSNCTQTNIRFCDWNSASVGFSGVALSLRVTGVDQTLLLDDLTFNTPSALPEPASLALTLGALGVLGWSRKRAAR